MVLFLTRVHLEIRGLPAAMVQEDLPGLQAPLGELSFCRVTQGTVVCQGHLALQAHQVPQDTKATQDVMDKMARKDRWESQDHRDHRVLRAHLEKRVYLDCQVYEGPLAPQVPKVNLDCLQIWMIAPESQGFRGCQAQEDRKELQDSLE